MSLGQNDNAILKLLADEQLRKENAALQAENERLRKAGDDLEFFIRLAHCTVESKMVVSAWRNAKEGQS